MLKKITFELLKSAEISISEVVIDNLPVSSLARTFLKSVYEKFSDWIHNQIKNYHNNNKEIIIESDSKNSEAFFILA